MTIKGKYPDPKILILGIGNYLLGDEGVGVHALREMEKMQWPENITLLDGGTGGFHLLEHLQSHDKVIMIDATMDQNPEGTIVVRTPKFANDFPPSLSSHDIGLKDLVNAMVLLDDLPEIFLFTITIRDISKVTTDLTKEIEIKVPNLISQVKEKVTTLCPQ